MRTPLHWRSLALLPAATALVAALVAPRTAAPHAGVRLLATALTAQIEGAVMVEPSASSQKAIAARFEAAGQERIAVIHYVCRLSMEQRQKLLLAWRGDLRRLTQTISRLTEEQRNSGNDGQKRAALELKILQHQMILEQGSVDSAALFDKVVLASLTEKQAVAYEPIREIFRAGGQVHLLRKEWDPTIHVHFEGGSLTDDESDQIGGMSVRLSGTAITDEGLSRIRGAHFTQLDLFACTAITDEGLVSLRTLPDLRHLNLGELDLRRLNLGGEVEARTHLTDAGLVHVGAVTGLEALQLSGPRFTDAGLLHLKPLVNLRRLILDGVSGTDRGIAILAGMSKLEQLEITSERVTDAGLVHLKNLSNLRSLSLTAPGISDSGLIHLRELKQLRHLRLGDGTVTREGLQTLALPNLRLVEFMDRTGATAKPEK